MSYKLSLLPPPLLEGLETLSNYLSVNFRRLEDYLDTYLANTGVHEDLAVFSKSGVQTVGTGAGRFRFPFSATIIGVSASIGTAPTGASFIVDVNKNGTTIYTTQANRPTIAASSNAASETVPDVTTVAAGDYLTVDRDQVGSTVAGSDLNVFVRYSRP